MCGFVADIASQPAAHLIVKFGCVLSDGSFLVLCVLVLLGILRRLNSVSDRRCIGFICLCPLTTSLISEFDITQAASVCRLNLLVFALCPFRHSATQLPYQSLSLSVQNFSSD